MRIRKVAAGLALAIGPGAVVLGAAAPAIACADCGPSASGYSGDGGGSVVVSDPFSRPGNGGGGGPIGGSGGVTTVLCTYYPVHDEASSSAGDAFALDPSSIAVGTTVWVDCFDVASNEFLWAGRIVWGGGPPPIPVPPVVLARRARADLALPVPAVRTWPPPASQVVNIPTWLHVDNFVAGTRSATAGIVTATVTAQPVRAEWVMGDGSTVTCSTGGAVYDPAKGEGTTDCSHSFVHTSANRPGGTFAGSASITWHLTWTSNVGAGGDLGTVTMTTAVGWRVEQIQALITTEGSR